MEVSTYINNILMSCNQKINKYRDKLAVLPMQWTVNTDNALEKNIFIFFHFLNLGILYI